MAQIAGLYAGSGQESESCPKDLECETDNECEPEWLNGKDECYWKWVECEDGVVIKLNMSELL